MSMGYTWRGGYHNKIYLVRSNSLCKYLTLWPWKLKWVTNILGLFLFVITMVLQKTKRTYRWQQCHCISKNSFSILCFHMLICYVISVKLPWWYKVLAISTSTCYNTPSTFYSMPKNDNYLHYNVPVEPLVVTVSCSVVILDPWVVVTTGGVSVVPTSILDSVRI